MNDAIGWAQEQKMRELADKARRRKDGKLNAQEEEMLGAIAKADMALGSLSRWPSLLEADMGGAPCQDLARQALALIDDEKVRAMALEELARQCVGLDKPAGWKFAISQGLDASAGPDAAAHWGRGIAFDRHDSMSVPSNWIARAVSRSAWRCVKEMAGDPKARAGCPGFDKDGVRLAIGAKQEAGPGWMKIGDSLVVSWEARPSEALAWLGRKAAGLESGDVESAKQVQEEVSGRQAIWLAQEGHARAGWLTANHPLLACWAMEVVDGEPKKAGRAEALKALGKAGFGPRWGEAEFELAASLLALRGSAGALQACQDAGVGPELALATMRLLSSSSLELEDDREDARGAAPSVWDPELACDGGVWVEHAWSKPAWARVAAWLDERMGEGTSRAMEERAAFDLLERAAEEWPRSKEHHGYARLDAALKWLEAAGPSADEALAREQVARLQEASIEAQEAESTRSGPGPGRERLRAVLKTWSESPALGIKKRKPLKA